MFRSNFLTICFAIAFTVLVHNQANATVKLDCQEYNSKNPLFYSFGLVTEFNYNSANLVNSMYVTSRYGEITHNFKNPVNPNHSLDQIKGVEKDNFNKHFMYNLGFENGCQFSFHTPTDIISYQKFDPRLNNIFDAVYMRVCSLDFNKNFSKIMACRFLSK